MREWLEFLAVFAGIYLFDCLHWARRGTVGFRASWWRRARLLTSGEMPGNERYGIAFAQPLPPFGRLFLTESFPLSLTRDLVVSFTSAAQNPGSRAPQLERVVALDGRPVAATEGRRVLVDGAVFVEAGSTRLARHIAALLDELAALEPKRREKRIDEWLRAHLDSAAAAERVALFERVSPPIRAASAAELLLVFVVTPAVGYAFGFHLAWAPLFAALVALQAFIAWSFVRAHRRLHESEERARRSEAVLIALSPPSAMRAFDALSRDLLAEFHPLAAALVLLPRAEFEALLESTLRDALHPLPTVREAADAVVASVGEEWRERLVDAYEVFAKREGVRGTPWRGAPRRLDAEALAYCPRCTQQFVRVGGGCERCGDIALKSFGPS